MPQQLFAYFPTQFNREKICKNREFSSENREIRSKDHRVRFSVHTRDSQRAAEIVKEVAAQESKNATAKARSLLVHDFR